MNRFGAALWIACSQFFLAEQLARLAWTQPYSFSRNYVSDLGGTLCSNTVCSPWHGLMNASFVLQGLLIASGAILTWKRWIRWARLGMCLLVISGVGVIAVGLVPEDVNGPLHRLGAAIHFLAAGVAMIAVGLNSGRWFSWLSVMVGLAVLTATTVLGGASASWLQETGIGTVERIAAYGVAGWMIVAGAWLCSQMRLEVTAGRIQ